jgi:hypothetical protein
MQTCEVKKFRGIVSNKVADPARCCSKCNRHAAMAQIGQAYAVVRLLRGDWELGALAARADRCSEYP